MNGFTVKHGSIVEIDPTAPVTYKDAAVDTQHERRSPTKFKNPFTCLFCGTTYEYGDPTHTHN
jgi:hypothetical protein